MTVSRLPRLTVLPILALLTSLIFASSVAAADREIASSGPLTQIIIGDQLNCQVAHTGDSTFEFFPSDTRIAACGTFVVAGGVLYSPASVPAGSQAVGTPFTPVSQTPVTGSGTAGDPYRIVTVVALGATGLTLTETDSYVTGNEYYQTDVLLALAAGGAASVPITVYRAGDCYLQNSDEGFGSVDTASGSVRCVAAADPANPSAGPGTRIEEWVPLTGGSSYYHADYSSVWSLIGAKSAFPNTCECATYQDNGAGLMWQFSILGGGSAAVSHLTNFSPLGFSAAPPTPAPTATPTPAPTVAAAATTAPAAVVLPNTAASPLAPLTSVFLAVFALSALALVARRVRSTTRR